MTIIISMGRPSDSIIKGPREIGFFDIPNYGAKALQIIETTEPPSPNGMLSKPCILPEPPLDSGITSELLAAKSVELPAKHKSCLIF